MIDAPNAHEHGADAGDGEHHGGDGEVNHHGDGDGDGDGDHHAGDGDGDHHYDDDAGDHEHADEPIADAGIAPDGSIVGEFEWNLPRGFPFPKVPLDNPMSNEKVLLGRHLFYDARLSGNETFSCASCHVQALAFTDGLATAEGSTGQPHPRGSMALANVAYAATLTWANPLFFLLERQVNIPLFGDSPIELGATIQLVEERMRAEPKYEELFAAAFPDEAEPITAHNANKALAAFQRTLISGRSGYDRWFWDGDDSEMSEAAQRGLSLFMGEAPVGGGDEHLECFHCHGGFNFTDHVDFENNAAGEALYHNTGLYNLDASGAYPEPNTGVYNVTLDERDMGFFKAPSLRNVAVTAPYMHDGSIASLDDVIDHYAAGGRTIADGPFAGVGSDNPHKDPLVKPFDLTAQQRADLIAFLESLTDEAFLTNPDFADPWP